MVRFTRRVPAPLFKYRYGNFRQAVRDDFENCCAYCYLHELYALTEDGFWLDHFYPKDEKRFPKRRDDFYNLYWSCYPCSKKKSNKFPPYEVLEAGICFVDLCNDDFDQHYRLRSDGRLEPLTTSAAYTIAALRLNAVLLMKFRAMLIELKRPLDRES